MSPASDPLPTTDCCTVCLGSWQCTGVSHLPSARARVSCACSEVSTLPSSGPSPLSGPQAPLDLSPVIPPLLTLLLPPFILATLVSLLLQTFQKPSPVSAQLPPHFLSVFAQMSTSWGGHPDLVPRSLPPICLFGSPGHLKHIPHLLMPPILSVLSTLGCKFHQGLGTS